ncbi:hypothetical protein [Liquorilactobacillus nagelii]|jgi:hypothetical protein|uniref:hypothetical protein n=1 Tax=Liquorilactobacillus nagelii TaxID=82688 RepID=UPI00242F82CF|nr:hypothetical protein [Liquorilactobacillus nagelii]MCI1699482.1 hypothetical protein [Liquorilactobacillus nagelii]
MSKIYNDFVNNVTETVYRSVNFASKRITPNNVSNYSIKKVMITSTSYSVQREVDQNAIENDYRKIGQDLFGALNSYERSRGFRITAKKA